MWLVQVPLYECNVCKGDGGNQIKVYSSTAILLGYCWRYKLTEYKSDFILHVLKVFKWKEMKF